MLALKYQKQKMALGLWKTPFKNAYTKYFPNDLILV